MTVREHVSPRGYHLHISLSPDTGIHFICCEPDTPPSQAGDWHDGAGGIAVVATRPPADGQSPPLLCYLRLV
jgi:hypothetical protein